MRPAKLQKEITLSQENQKRCSSFGLTGRELKVVRRLVEGYSNEDMAADLSTSGELVNRHIASILGKLGASNHLEIVLFAVFHQLVDDPK